MIVAGFGVLNLCGCAGKADEPKKDESSFKADFELGELRVLDAIDYDELLEASRGVALARLDYSVELSGDEDRDALFDFNDFTVYQNGVRLDVLGEVSNGESDDPDYAPALDETIRAGYSYDSRVFIFLKGTDSDIDVEVMPYGDENQLVKKTYSLK